MEWNEMISYRLESQLFSETVSTSLSSLCFYLQPEVYGTFLSQGFGLELYNELKNLKTIGRSVLNSSQVLNIMYFCTNRTDKKILREVKKEWGTET